MSTSAVERSGRRPPATIQAVVIGASTGGVEALSVILPALPARGSAAVFVVQHLPRDRPSLLVEIFAPRCAAAVREAEDKEPVEPGTIYFAPADYHLLVAPGPHIALSVDELVNHSRPSIDVLFESAAEVYRERLLGVILTGASTDGAAGLEAVCRGGGRAVVQQPEEAVADRMPSSALRRPLGQRVLDLQEIGALFRTLNGGAPA
jgi:two-component system, chemotaxis family, protein-glutamate methylesterase/glutaminase